MLRRILITRIQQQPEEGVPAAGWGRLDKEDGPVAGVGAVRLYLLRSTAPPHLPLQLLLVAIREQILVCLYDGGSIRTMGNKSVCLVFYDALVLQFHLLCQRI
jgi:hypothetical protein